MSIPRPEAALPASSLRTPAISVLANGAELAGVTEARIIAVNNFGADRFTVRAALSAVDPGAWQADGIDLEIRIGLDGAWVSLVQGAVDAIDIDPIRFTLTLSGRDYSAALIQAKTQESFQNQTSSQIATLLAGRHGLTAQVTATSTPVGRYYQIEHDSITLNQFTRATTEWDLLSFLARQEGFDLFVQGTALYFQPPTGLSAQPIAITPRDCTDLALHRALTLAGDIEVTVKSWNSRQQNAFTQTARASGRGGAGRGGSRGSRQSTVIVRPNLTPDQALQLAQSILADLSRHERVVTLSMPGELSITPRSPIALSGTGTDFDQTYHIAEIERALSFERGFTQRIRARNMSSADTTVPATSYTNATPP
jgi:phage protein D